MGEEEEAAVRGEVAHGQPHQSPSPTRSRHTNASRADPRTRRTWRKITFGFRDSPVGASRLPAAKPASGVPRLEAVRQAALAQRQRALPRQLQPLAKGKGFVDSTDPASVTPALRRQYRSLGEMEERKKRRVEVLESRPHSYKLRVQEVEAKRRKHLPPLRDARPAASSPTATERRANASPPASSGTSPPPQAAPQKKKGEPRHPVTHQSEAPPLEELLRIVDAPTLRRLRREVRRRSSVVVVSTPLEERGEEWEDAVEDARAAREADAKCPDQAAVLAVRMAILAQTSYRVPTGDKFWERIQAVREGRLRAGAEEVREKYQREAEASLANVHDFLLRLYRATGLHLSLEAHTSLDIDGFDSPKGKKGDKWLLKDLARRFPSKLWLQALTKEEEKTLEGEMPEVPPGWLVAKDKDDPTSVYVSVAGTQNLNDCFRDCNFVPIPFTMPAGAEGEEHSVPEEWSNVRVHAGFFDGAERIWNALLPALRAVRSGDVTRVHFTGHSLGGATAILLACFLAVAGREEGLELASLHTFGAPNLFVLEEWPQDIAFLPTSVVQHQYVNGRDVVPRALGSPVIQKIARLGIRLGFKALACVDQENAAALPLYRFVGPLLHHIDKEGDVLDFDTREGQAGLLALSATDLRPQAGIDHKMGNYIGKLINRLDKLTGHTHPYTQEVSLSADGSAHPISAAVFDEKEDMQLTKQFASASKNIFERFRTHKGGGIDKIALASLFQWTGRAFPEYLMEERILKGRYEVEDGCLTEEGWNCFVEDKCYTSLPWIAALFAATGWRHEGSSLSLAKKTIEGQRTRDHTSPDHLLKAAPLLTPEGGLGGCAEVVLRLFRVYARPHGDAGTVIRSVGMHVFAGNINTLELYNTEAMEPLVATRIAAASSSKWIDMARPDDSPPLHQLTPEDWNRMWIRVATEDPVRTFDILHRGAGWDPVGCGVHSRNGPLWKSSDLDERLRLADEFTQRRADGLKAQADEELRQKLWRAVCVRSGRRVSAAHAPSPDPPLHHIL
eukprot:Hpha_TRINITY_DN16792_c3_g3::TRINITY_DN16792_c3_g3_i1::g.77326::m.77326